MTSTTILAIDLGKYKCVSCAYDRVTADAQFRTLTTSRAEVERLIRDAGPAVVVSQREPVTPARSFLYPRRRCRRRVAERMGGVADTSCWDGTDRPSGGCRSPNSRVRPDGEPGPMLTSPAVSGPGSPLPQRSAGSGAEKPREGRRQTIGDRST